MAGRRRLSAFSALVAGVLLLAACGGEATPTAEPTAGSGGPASAVTGTIAISGTASAGTGSQAGGAGDKVKIGFAFATSGDSAAYGYSQKGAAQLAVAELNAAGQGPQITPFFEDTAGVPDRAVAAFRKFIDSDNVDAIVGPTLSTEAQASDPVAQEAKVPVLGVSNTAAGITDIGAYIFRDSLAEFQVIPATIKAAKTKFNLTKVSLLYAKDDAFSKSGADVFRQELQTNNIKILSEQTFSTKDTDYKLQLTTIKGEKPDAIVVSALAGPARMILQQARNDVGIDPAVPIIGGNGFNSPPVLKGAGSAAEGLVVGAAWNPNSADPASTRFVAGYTRATGKAPDQFAAQSYAGVYILHDAIKRANVQGKSLENARTAIRDALKSTDKVATVLGAFSFTDKRDASHPPVVQIVKDGKLEILSSSGAGQ